LRLIIGFEAFIGLLLLSFGTLNYLHSLKHLHSLNF